MTLGRSIFSIQSLFDHLAWACLTINLAKCELSQATVTYLGKVVGQGQVGPVREKVLAVSCTDYQERALSFLGYGGVLPWVL